MSDRVDLIQAILDVLPGSAALIVPVRDAAGQIADWTFAATSPDSHDVHGRHGNELIGHRVLELYPAVAGSDLLTTQQHAYETGESVDVGPFDYVEGGKRRRFSMRFRPLAPGLLVSWIPYDRTERLLRLSNARLRFTWRELEAQQRRLVEEHQLATALQQIILPVPAEPLDLPGLRVAVRYAPAEQAAHVGGDWYHALRLSDGTVLLAIGDVAGHGLPAASVMAQLRHALTGLAVVRTAPADLLAALNTVLCEQVTEQTLATAVVTVYDPATRRLTWAQAGHPPLLLVRAGAAAPLPRPAGMVLGATTPVAYDTECAILEPGDLVVMYTDGLVETADLTVEAGLAVLAATAAGGLEGILGALHLANPDDDTCLLVAQIS